MFLIPLNTSISNLVSYSEEGKSPFLARYNRQKAVTISARLVGNYSLDEALKFLVKVVEENTPEAKIAYKGESEEYKKTNTELYIIFILLYYLWVKCKCPYMLKLYMISLMIFFPKNLYRVFSESYKTKLNS